MKKQSKKENKGAQNNTIKNKMSLAEEVEYMKKHPMSWEEKRLQALRLKMNRENEEKNRREIILKKHYKF